METWMRAKASAEPAIAVATPNGSSRPNRSRRKNASSATAASVFNATAPPVAGIRACPPPISRPAANAMSPMRRTGRTAAAQGSSFGSAGSGTASPADGCGKAGEAPPEELPDGGRAGGRNAGGRTGARR